MSLTPPGSMGQQPSIFGKPPRGSPLLWQLLLSPLTMCQHVAFCTSGCHSSVPGEGAPPSPHPAVIDCHSAGFSPGRPRVLLLEAAIQGFLVAESPASYCSPQTLPSRVPSATNGLPTSCNCLGSTSEFVCLLRDVLPQGAPLDGSESLAAT